MQQKRRLAYLGGIAVVGAVLAFGCSASDTDTSRAPGNNAVPEAGSGGVEEPASEGGAAGAVRTPGASGGAAPESEGGNAGDAGTAGACAGDYLCPLVGYGSRAVISFDLPISVASAADAVFTACRNSECHTAKGSATVALNGNPEWGWADEVGGSSIYLTFDGSGSAPFGVLRWNFQQDFVTIPSDHFSLRVQPVGASAPIMLFDTDINYKIIAADPTLVSEGFCHRCSEVSIAELDLRTTK